MRSGRTNGRLLGAVLAVTAGVGCLGLPDMATETGEPTALSADGRRMRLIYRNRGWSENREAYELYTKIPSLSAGSLTVMGLRLALPTRWGDNTPISFITFDTRWSTDAEMAVAIFHRPEGTTGAWQPLRCAGAAASNDLQYFHASQAFIDLQNGELELVPVGASAGSYDPSAFEREGATRGRSRDIGRRQAPSAVTLSTFQQCGITEMSPELSAFVFPYSAGYWSERFDYDFAATCDGDPCPAYRGDPNEPRGRNDSQNGSKGSNNWNNNNWVNTDPSRTAWDITDDGSWQCGRTTVYGQGNVSSVRLEIRGRHARSSELEATIKKVNGQTNVQLFTTQSGLYFPITRAVATSNEPWAGTWELCVRDDTRGDTGRIDGWSITRDQAGGGGSVANVTSVTAGASREDSLSRNESDWFSISLQANQTLVVETSGTACAGGSLDTVLSLHSSLPSSRPTAGRCPDEDGAEWTSSATIDCEDQVEGGSNNGDCSRLEQQVDAYGTYYVRVFGWDNDESGAYTITFTVR